MGVETFLDVFDEGVVVERRPAEECRVHVASRERIFCEALEAGYEQ